jgi:N-acetylglutamate synthase-like GNAT family acetyltransferase
VVAPIVSEMLGERAHPDIEIRLASAQDSGQIAEMYEIAFSEHILVHEGKLNNPEFINGMIADPNVHYIVASQNGKIVGAAALAIADIIKGGEIERVVVADEYRGNGLSKDLCGELVGVAKEQGLQYVFAFARGGMKPMQKTFRNLGFEVFGVMPIFAIVHEGRVVRENFVHMGLLIEPESLYDNNDLIPEAQRLYDVINSE